MPADPENAPLSAGLRGPLGWTAAGLACLLTLGAIVWALDLFQRAGIGVLLEQYLAAMLGLALALVYLLLPLRRGTQRKRVPVYDMALAVLGLAAGSYIAWIYPDVIDDVMAEPVDALVAAAILILLCIEGLRRAVGWVLVIISLTFMGYALVGHLFEGMLQTRDVSVERLVLYLGLDPSALLGLAMKIGLTVVIGFVLFGQFLSRSGGSEFFNDLSIALMGRFRGGSAKISVTASSLFGSISGVAVSNILATGVITIPMMKKSGYKPESAAAIEAVASTGGQLMPPVMGAVAFLMADMLATDYSEIVLAALIPAVLYYAALFILADLEAAKRGISRVEARHIPPLGEVLKRGWFFALPFAVLIYGIFWLNLRPETAAVYAAGAVLLVGVTVGYRGRRMGLGDIWTAIVRTGQSIFDIVMIVAAAGFIMGVLNLTGLGFAVTVGLVDVGAGNILIQLLIAGAICIVLGMGLPTVGVYILLAVLIAPSLVEVGVPKIAAHMFIFYFGMLSMLTPPVAIAAFFAASLARASPMRTAFSAMRFGWTAYVVPLLFVFSPSLLMDATTEQVILALVSALAGVWLISAAFIGYGMREMSASMRVVFVVAGVALLIPPDLAPWAWWFAVAGAILGVLAVAVEWVQSRRPAAA